MPTIAEAMHEAYLNGKDKGVSTNDLRLLVMHNEGYTEHIDVLLHQDEPMKHYALFRQQCRRLIDDDMPVEYILHQADFLGIPLYVDENVLIPRGETEELVAKLTEEIGNYYDPRNYLVCGDIGTGSGCIPLALHSSFPNWLFAASDISSAALTVAKKNFHDHQMNVQTFLGDALTPYIENKTNLDIIISNPPYILNPEDAQESVRRYEPASALWLDPAHSVYESIFRDYRKVKSGDILMVFEISPDLKDWLEKLIHQYMKHPEYHFEKDLNGFDRFLFVYEE
ncbi:MAG: peptide chain release factor N(5)-glutamine methyltransferase [Erysipelotrichaceae bacterium]|nr:peptide chain release factor N(5)-glutamine methyltransferase [Erysipelotrichaceae bacterium]